MYKSARSKATDIPQSVKDAVWKRDGQKCIICKSPNAKPNAHYIPRSAGGLGIVQNTVSLCERCHREYDQSTERPMYRNRIRQYLMRKHSNWNEESLIYKKEHL